MSRVLAIGLTAGALALGGWRLAYGFATADFNVVRVAGELTAAERAQVRDAVTAERARGGPLSAAAVVAAVRRLVWVRHVWARRRWPDSLHLVVGRETPAARWGEDAWISSDGTVVRTVRTESPEATFAALPTIRAARADGRRAMAVLSDINAEAASAGLRVAALTESPAGDWTATFAGGAQVVLGHTELRRRTRRFGAVHRALLAPDQADARPVGLAMLADARYQNGVAVRWRRLAVDDDPAGFGGVAAAWPPPGTRLSAPEIHR